MQVQVILALWGESVTTQPLLEEQNLQTRKPGKIRTTPEDEMAL